MAGIKIIYGTGGVAFRDTNNIQLAKDTLQVLKKYDVKNLDSAQLYGASESVLGDIGAGSDFIIDTKAVGGFTPGSLQSDNLYKSAHESISKLKVKQVDIFYIHAPDSNAPLAEWVPTIDKLHKEGIFKRFGVSNFTPDQVKELYNFSKEHNYVFFA